MTTEGSTLQPGESANRVTSSLRATCCARCCAPLNDDGELNGVLSAMDVLRVLVDQAGPLELDYVDLRTTEVVSPRGKG